MSPISSIQWTSLHFDSSGSIADLIFGFDQNEEPLFIARSTSGEVYTIDIIEGRKKLYHAVSDINYFAEKVNFIALAGETHTLFGIVDTKNLVYATDLSLQLLLPPWGPRTTTSTFPGEIPTFVCPINREVGTQLLIATNGATPNFYLYDPASKVVIQAFRSTDTAACSAPKVVLIAENPANKENPDYYMISLYCIIRWQYVGNSYSQTLMVTSALLGGIKATLYIVGEKTYLISVGHLSQGRIRVIIFDTSTETSPADFTYTSQDLSSVYVYSLAVGQSNEIDDVVAIGLSNGDVLTCSLTDFFKAGTLSCKSIIPSFQPASGVSGMKFGLLVNEDSLTIFSLIIVRVNGNVHIFNFKTGSFTQLASSSDWPTYSNVNSQEHIFFVRLSKDAGTGQLAIRHRQSIYLLDATEDASSSLQFLNYDGEQSSSRKIKSMGIAQDILLYPKVCQSPLHATNLGILSYNQIVSFIDQSTQLEATLTSTCSGEDPLVYTIVGYDCPSQETRFDSLKVIVVAQDGNQKTLTYPTLVKQKSASSCDYLWTSTFVITPDP